MNNLALFPYLLLVVLMIFSVTLSVRSFLLGDIDLGIAWLGPSLAGLVGVISLWFHWRKKFLN